MTPAVAPFGAITVFRLVQGVARVIERLRAPRAPRRLSETELTELGLGERGRRVPHDDLVARALAYRV